MKGVYLYLHSTQINLDPLRCVHVYSSDDWWQALHLLYFTCMYIILLAVSATVTIESQGCPISFIAVPKE